MYYTKIQMKLFSKDLEMTSNLKNFLSLLPNLDRSKLVYWVTAHAGQINRLSWPPYTYQRFWESFPEENSIHVFRSLKSFYEKNTVHIA